MPMAGSIYSTRRARPPSSNLGARSRCSRKIRSPMASWLRQRHRARRFSSERRLTCIELNPWPQQANKQVGSLTLMSRLPENEFQGALKILSGYYERLMKETAEDIIKHVDDFEGPFGNPDNLL